MGRTGITLFEVEEAAAKLQGRGKTASVDNIREILGTGSKSTIAQHLKIWKSKQDVVHGALPSELLALVSGIWERLNTEANKRIVEVESECHDKIQALQATLNHSQRSFEELKIHFHQLEEQCFTERNLKEEHIKWLQDEKQTCIKWQERYQEGTKLIDIQKAENVRLHQLANNIQASYEHYQESVQKARSEQTLIIENQQQEFQKEKSELQDLLSTYREQTHLFQQQIEQRNSECLELKSHYELLKERNVKKEMQVEKNSRENVVLQERNEQGEKQIQIYKKELADKDSIILKLEKEVSILSDRNNQLQGALSNAEDKIETLRQEKLFLTQEKSELQGYIKQWETVRK